MTAAKSYVSWALRENGLPTFTLPNAGNYPKAFDYYKTLKKDPAWSAYSPDKAKSLSEKEVKRIAHYKIRDKKGNLVATKLRDKVGAFMLCHMGFHPEDCKRANLTKMTRLRQTGPYNKETVKLDGVATKRPGTKVRNYWVCGCHPQKPHDPNNDMCELALIDNLVESLGEDKAKENLFWTTNNRGMGWGARQQKKDTMAKCLQRINRDMGISPEEEWTGEMGRKTFATLGTKFFYFPQRLQMEVSHHETFHHFEGYIDPEYVNVSRETMPSRLIQYYEQGTLEPPAIASVPHGLALLHGELSELKTLVLQLVDKPKTLRRLTEKETMLCLMPSE